MKNNVRSIICLFESVEGINNVINIQVQRYGEVFYDYYEKVKNLNYEDCEKLINALDFSHNTKTIVHKN